MCSSDLNIKSTIFQGDNDIHDNDNSPTSNIVDNDSNCLHDTSDSNKSYSFLKGSNRLGSTMLCLSDSSLSNTSYNSFAHHHPMAVNNESTNFYCDDDMHDNNDNSNSKVVDNDSNCLHDTSDSNKSYSFLKGSNTHEDSMVFINALS